MTFHEKLTKEILDSFDRGILSRERLELLQKELLKGDELYTELYSEHIFSNNEKDAVIKFLKKELAHKTSFRNVMKRQYKELQQKCKAQEEKINRLVNECQDMSIKICELERKN